MARDLARLGRALQYEFDSPELLSAALTHRSAAGKNNERLEFLGDAVLGVVIAESLYQTRPRAREGELSRLRAALVKKSTLADLASELDLGEYLKLGRGELRTGGFRRTSILADALEAVFGAIYLDGGYEAARACIRRLYVDRLAALPPAAEDVKDPKSQLQELLQARGVVVPTYEVAEARGAAHELQFTVHCRVEALGLSEHGHGSSRRAAEQAAARRLLQRLREAGDEIFGKR